MRPETTQSLPLIALMYRHLLSLLLVVLPLHAAEFSIYLTPPDLSANGKALASVADLQIDVAGQAVPLELVEGRQSITYPCQAGTVISLFRLAQDQAKTRTPVVSCSMPQDAAKGLLVLSPTADGYRISPFWFTTSELRNGSGLFVNLTTRDLGIVCGEKRVQLAPGKRTDIEGKFHGSEALVPTHVEIFARGGQGGAELVRLLNRQVGVPKDDTAIFMILPKQEDYVTLLTLECSGLRDAQAKDALIHRIAPKEAAAKLPAQANASL